MREVINNHVNNLVLFYKTTDLVSAALIVTSVASFIQVYQIKIPYTNYVIGKNKLIPRNHKLVHYL